MKHICMSLSIKHAKKLFETRRCDTVVRYFFENKLKSDSIAFVNFVINFSSAVFPLNVFAST